MVMNMAMFITVVSNPLYYYQSLLWLLIWLLTRLLVCPWLADDQSTSNLVSYSNLVGHLMMDQSCFVMSDTWVRMMAIAGKNDK